MNQPPELLKTLAHGLRWQLLKTLAQGDLRVQEMVAQVQEPINLVSYHLKKLRDDGIVTMRRSEADGRDVYYSLDVASLRALYYEVATHLHPSLLPADLPLQVPSVHVLFVCTHNSARSQMAHGLLNAQGYPQIVVKSAGSHPTKIHPDALLTMDSLGIDIRTHGTHHLNDYQHETFDYVITVCDNAREVCPIFGNSGTTLHWGYADPTLIGDETARRQAFLHIATQLQRRVQHFLRSLNPALLGHAP
jgi:protein-tyrosine-phosphatase/DNA-binding transcriptional ArsR family regulator